MNSSHVKQAVGQVQRPRIKRKNWTKLSIAFTLEKSKPQIPKTLDIDLDGVGCFEFVGLEQSSRIPDISEILKSPETPTIPNLKQPSPNSTNPGRGSGYLIVLDLLEFGLVQSSVLFWMWICGIGIQKLYIGATVSQRGGSGKCRKHCYLIVRRRQVGLEGGGDSTCICMCVCIEYYHKYICICVLYIGTRVYIHPYLDLHMHMHIICICTQCIWKKVQKSDPRIYLGPRLQVAPSKGRGW